MKNNCGCSSNEIKNAQCSIFDCITDFLNYFLYYYFQIEVVFLCESYNVVYDICWFKIIYDFKKKRKVYWSAEILDCFCLFYYSEKLELQDLAESCPVAIVIKMLWFYILPLHNICIISLWHQAGIRSKWYQLSWFSQCHHICLFFVNVKTLFSHENAEERWLSSWLDKLSVLTAVTLFKIL